MTQQVAELEELAARIWTMAGGQPETAAGLTVSGSRAVLPSVFDVTGLATASVGAAALAAAEYHATRNAAPVVAVRVDTLAACAAFAAEGLFTPEGWSRPEIWDPVAGNYQARDGWIRLHTNYAYHRAAAAQVLKADDRDGVQAAVSKWTADELEAAIVAAGGCAAAMHDRESWLASPAGAASAADQPVTAVERPLPGWPAETGRAADPAQRAGNQAGQAGDRAKRVGGPAAQPYARVRVLDLTRVIAGPECTRFLAAYGADVLRIDPPGFAEVPALLPETTAGKRTASLDLTAAPDRAVFEQLVAGADVLVTGLRGDALDRLGYDDETLTGLNPALITASLNAYGWTGPWRDRRGFDSLVQMSCGIAAAGGAATGSDRPGPLPVQALDHATGYLLAASVGRALTTMLNTQASSRIRASLTGTANLLWSLPRPADMAGPPTMPRPADIPLTPTQTAWGPARRVALPGEIDGITPELRVEAGPLGRHQPVW
jgi:CoA-transferase family III